MKIIIKEEKFDVAETIKAFQESQGNVGAMVTFTGIVRNKEDEQLEFMEIEHYPGMVEKAISEIVNKAKKSWSIADVLVIHRFGKLALSETIMMVATAANHRKDAFQAAEFIMDYLKSRAPFWKKETAKNSASWVQSRKQDQTDLNRWE